MYILCVYMYRYMYMYMYIYINIYTHTGVAREEMETMQSMCADRFVTPVTKP
jgi:hypothetical protein